VQSKIQSFAYNFAANLVGRAWIGALNLLMVPIYIQYLGIESYGLVGFYATLQAAFGILDLGLSATLNQQLARYSAQPGRNQEMRDFAKTLQTLYLGISAVIGLSVFLSAPLIAAHWLTSSIEPTVLQRALTLMGITIAFQWLLGFFNSGILGLQYQIPANLLAAAIATVRAFGVVPILVISADIVTFFAWQAAATAIGAGVTAKIFWKCLSGADRPQFRLPLLLTVKQYVTGMSITALLGLGLSQIDRLTVSAVMPLREFAVYSLAALLASSIQYLSTPVSIALLPKLANYLEGGAEQSFSLLFDRACQLLVVLVSPTCGLLAIFAPEVLFVWTGNRQLAAEAWLSTSLLVFGAGLNAFGGQFYLLQLAHGKSLYCAYINFGAFLVILPLMYLVVSMYGVMGAALMMLLVNAYYLVAHFTISKRWIVGRRAHWVWRVFVLPTVSALVVLGSARMWFPIPTGRIGLIAIMSVFWLIATVASLFTAPFVYQWRTTRQRRTFA
jgi:O-antigen/teichoic acid export membrane protein